MKNELITFVSPKAPISETFRTLRTNIQFMNVDGDLKTLLITSTVPGEGKSWIASNLAVTFAQAGKRVLLVDADMRKGRQHSIFEVKNDKGLSNYLIMTTKNEAMEAMGDYVQTTLIDNLYIMTAGMVPPNPSELLTSQKMVDLIKSFKKVFDIVIFDGTPSTIVTDAIILSKFVDSTIIVSAHKQTKIDDLNQVKRNILNVGGKIAGVVVNKMPISKKEYKSDYYYGYGIVSSKKKSWETAPKQNNKKKLEDNEIKEVKKKLSKVDKPANKEEKKENNEEIDINSVLKQLTQYLSETEKK